MTAKGGFALRIVLGGLVGLGNGWPGIARSEAKNHGPPQVHLALDTGWNLVAHSIFDAHDFETQLAKSALVRFPAVRSEHGPQFVDSSTATFGPSEGTWIYAPQPTSLSVLTESRPKTRLSLAAPGWTVVGRPEAAPLGGAAVTRLLAWDASSGVYRALATDNMLQPGVGYWAYQAVELKEPQPPSGLFGTSVHDQVRLWWSHPTHFRDGSPMPLEADLSYRILRNDVELGITKSLTFHDQGPSRGQSDSYTVITQMHDHQHRVKESLSSAPVRIRTSAPSVPKAIGDFEQPSVAQAHPRLRLPQTALARTSKGVLAHIAVASYTPETGGTAIRYLRSDQAGKAGTFTHSATLARLNRAEELIDLAVAAQGQQISVAWIRTSDLGTRVFLALSRDGGLSFHEPKSIRQGLPWKKGLDVAFDSGGGHHMVWGENHKIYYLGPLATEASNVFDQEVRTPATEQVRYQIYYAPDPDCRCPSCWCDESYPLSEEPHPTDPNRAIGPYVYRVEEAYMAEPSLEVDDRSVTIIARQDRMWDNRPVVQPTWTAMTASPIYGPTIMNRLRPIRALAGWRKTWKPAYEAGDELLWPTLGTQFQYRYEGTWHRQRQIKVAQRPLYFGAWSGGLNPLLPRHAPGRSGDSVHSVSDLASGPPLDRPREQMWQQGTWQDDRLQGWRISVVDSGVDSAPDWKGLHPKVTSQRDGRMVAVFEKTESDGADTPNNGIFVAYSHDGGQSWTAPTSVTRGHTPEALATQPNETSIVYFRSEDASSDHAIEVVRGQEASTFSPPEILNDQLSKTLSVPGQKNLAAPLFGAPSLSALEDLLFVAWIRPPKAGEGNEELVTTRASKDASFYQWAITLPDEVILEKGTPITVTAENKYHMRLDHRAEVTLEEVLNPQTTSGASHISTTVSGLAPWLHSAADRTLSVEHGVATAFMTGTVSALSLLAAAPVDMALQTKTTLIPKSPGGNHERAVLVRDRLLRGGDSDRNPAFFFQVEYEAKMPSAQITEQARQDIEQDNAHLAHFERVWAYTQGIALAQYAREKDPNYLEPARGLARYLCARADRAKGGGRIHGWPFSWNTKGDGWKDRRLVTGATAWVVHGLGVYLGSETFKALEDRSERDQIRECYLAALDGLRAHRHRLVLKGGRKVSLMTAGYTAAGLAHVNDPWSLTVNNRALTENQNDRFAYYSVLDAIGYDVYTPTEIKVCGLGSACQPDASEADVPAPEWTTRNIDEEEWASLRKRVPSTHVVTEHNLDVLSVLNHAIRFPEGLDGQRVNDLKVWRDELMDGIFYALWDEEGWKQEFEGVLLALGREDVGSLNQDRAGARQKRIEGIKKALASGLLGRVVTGGSLNQSATSNDTFEPSPHTAIDNCSWLSLSVDYETLGEAGQSTATEYVERLAQCLQYTVLQYVKALPVRDSWCDASSLSCSQERTYRGTHYFQNSFRDPYIEPSELQESSYHLEATAGLAWGLFRFAHAHPEHAMSENFLQEARLLYRGMQDFVRDHGFAYSSERIQDLSTRLSSSTAAIWFIDLYQYLQSIDEDPNRPVPHYALGAPTERRRQERDAAYRLLQEGTTRAPLIHSNPTAEASAERSALSEVEKSSDPSLPDKTSGTTTKPLTKVQDQAYLVLVAVNQGDYQAAARWVDELLPAQTPAGGEDSSNPLLGESQGDHGPMQDSTYGLRDRVLALYAIAWFVHHAPDSPQRAAAEEALVPMIASLLSALEISDGSPKPDLVPHPKDAPVLATENQVLAFFALDLAEAALSFAPADSEALVRNALRDYLSLSGNTLLTRCGLRNGQVSDAVWAEGRGALASCSLFASHNGYPQAARTLTDALFWAPQPEASENSTALELLARRALAAWAPRQEELVHIGLAKGLLHPDQTTATLWALLVDNPRGAFGVEGGSLFENSRPASLDSSIPPEQKARISTHLANHSLDLVLRLLASDMGAHRIDTILGEFAQTQRAFAELVGPVAQGPAETFSQLKWSLSQGLCHEDHIVHAASVPLKTYLGIDCHLAQSMIRKRFEARERLFGGATPSKPTTRYGRSGYSKMVRALLGSPSPNRKGSPGLVLGIDEATGLSVDPEILDWSQAEAYSRGPEAQPEAYPVWLRKRMDSVVRQSLKNAQTGAPKDTHFELQGMDLILAMNPASAEFWSQSAIALRVALHSEFENHITFTINGRIAARPEQPRGTEELRNVTTLRRKTNMLFGGGLWQLAEQSTLPTEVAWVAAMHRTLRTGVFYETDFQTWANALRLSKKTQDALRDEFTLTPSSEAQPGFLPRGEAHSTPYVVPPYGASFVSGVAFFQPIFQAAVQSIDDLIVVLSSQAPWLAKELTTHLPHATLPPEASLKERCAPSPNAWALEKVGGFWILCVRPEGSFLWPSGSATFPLRSIDEARTRLQLLGGIHGHNTPAIIYEPGGTLKTIEKRHNTFNFIYAAQTAPTAPSEPPSAEFSHVSAGNQQVFVKLRAHFDPQEDQVQVVCFQDQRFSSAKSTPWSVDSQANIFVADVSLHGIDSSGQTLVSFSYDGLRFPASVVSERLAFEGLFGAFLAKYTSRPVSGPKLRCYFFIDYGLKGESEAMLRAIAKFAKAHGPVAFFQRNPLTEIYNFLPTGEYGLHTLEELRAQSGLASNPVEIAFEKKDLVANAELDQVGDTHWITVHFRAPELDAFEQANLVIYVFKSKKNDVDHAPLEFAAIETGFSWALREEQVFVINKDTKIEYDNPNSHPFVTNEQRNLEDFLAQVKEDEEVRVSAQFVRTDEQGFDLFDLGRDIPVRSEGSPKVQNTEFGPPTPILFQDGDTDDQAANFDQAFFEGPTSLGLTRLPRMKTKSGHIGWSRGLYNGFKTMLNMEPQAAALFAPAAVTAAFGVSLASENDVALETMVTLNGPTTNEWLHMGSIPVHHVMHEVGPNTGVFSFFYDEDQIRRFGRFTTHDGTEQSFDQSKIYAFDLRNLPDLVPLDTIVGDGHAGVVGLPPTDFLKSNPHDEHLGVFVLSTEKDRQQVVDTFFDHHLWWQHVLDIATFIPGDENRNAWLRTMRSMFLGWFFNQEIAAMVVRGAPDPDDHPIWWNQMPTSVQAASASSNNPSSGEDESYWYATTQKPVYWSKERPDDPNAFMYRPSKRSMVEKFNNYGFVEDFIKKLLLSHSPRELDFIRKVIPPRYNFRLSHDLIDKALFPLGLKTTWPKIPFYDITVWDEEGWTEVNRFYHPLNSASQMKALQEWEEMDTSPERFSIIRHQLRR